MLFPIYSYDENVVWLETSRQISKVRILPTISLINNKSHHAHNFL